MIKRAIGSGLGLGSDSGLGLDFRVQHFNSLTPYIKLHIVGTANRRMSKGGIALLSLLS
jgi:hypothetical protein